jgi:hypothetical protein
VYGEQNLLLSCANLPYIFVDSPKINLHYELEMHHIFRVFVSKIKINLKGLSTHCKEPIPQIGNKNS